jgi:hypothetical protein
VVSVIDRLWNPDMKADKNIFFQDQAPKPKKSQLFGQASSQINQEKILSVVFLRIADPGFNYFNIMNNFSILSGLLK